MHYRKDTRCFSASLQFTLADSEALRHQPCSHCHNIHSDAWQHIHYYSKTLMFRCAGGSSGALATWFGASLCHLDMVPCAPTVWAPCPATAVASGTLESFRTFVCMQRHTRDPGLFDEASCELASIIPPPKKKHCACACICFYMGGLHCRLPARCCWQRPRRQARQAAEPEEPDSASPPQTRAGDGRDPLLL